MRLTAAPDRGTLPKARGRRLGDRGSELKLGDEGSELKRGDTGSETKRSTLPNDRHPVTGASPGSMPQARSGRGK